MTVQGLKIIIIITLFAGVTGSLYAQETEPVETATPVYSDILFNNYIELETSILEMIGTESMGTDALTSINEMLLKMETENRTDILSRLNMLKFVVESEIKNLEREANTEQLIAEFTAEEAKYRTQTAARKIGQTAMEISIGTAIVSGSIFAASALISGDYYKKYTETEYADQAAFYLFWWQLLDNISIVSAVTAIVSSTAAGILAAVF